MGKTLIKQTFGVPSAEVLTAIEASDKCTALEAAHYRFQTKVAALECQFETKASELRAAYLAEVAEIQAA
jgi:hypothetical protein